MRSKIITGIVAGIIAGLPMGFAMQMMSAPRMGGGEMPMMAMLAKVVHSDSIAVGWVYHLFNSAVIGALFGWWFGRREHGIGRGLGWGTLYGVFWWILGGLILMPLFLGMPAFSALRDPMMRPVAMGSLAGHILYGIVLGAVYVGLMRHREVPMVLHSAEEGR